MNVHFSSKTDLWSTPQDFFDKLDKEFSFSLDPCATPDNVSNTQRYRMLGNGWTVEVIKHIFSKLEAEL